MMPKATTKIVRSLRGGQLTIPVEFRKTLGIGEDTLLRLTLDDGELRIRPVKVTENTGSDWLKELYEYFAPVRAEAIESGLDEGEINEAIDRAVAAVRDERA
ncbi:MAG TPA: AbrB/MazE/SpoVT family DNA-binding domain-containing protein [Chloroflexota bacterium]|nr:AbrB/MazE/SpoVT family DNA-binding domain-containing protein [Chloroflexota bacterium]